MFYMILLLGIAATVSTSIFTEGQELSTGLPKEIHAVLEFSPAVPKLGEPFYVRFFLENKGEEPIFVPIGYFSHWHWYDGGDKSFLLGLDTSIPIPRLPATMHESGNPFVILNPRILTRNQILAPRGGREEVVLLAGGEKLCTYLEEHTFDLELESKNDIWKAFIEDTNIKLCYSSFWARGDGVTSVKSKVDTIYYYGSNSTIFDYKIFVPIRFADDTIAELLRIAKLERAKPRIEPAPELSPHPTGLPVNRKLISLKNREELEKHYPSGTARSKEYIMNTWEQIQIQGSTDADVDGFARYLWTLPEMERQYFTTRMLFVPHEEKITGFFRSRKFFFEILRMLPNEYIVAGKDKSSLLIEHYQQFQDISLEELKKDFVEHLKLPIPSDAGKGNTIRGFIP